MLKRVTWKDGFFDNNDSHLLFLDKNENCDFILRKFVEDNFIKQLKSSDIFEYPKLRPAYTRLINLFGFKDDCIFLTNGAEHSIKSILEICQNKSITMTDPTFKMAEVYSKMYGMSQIKIQYRFNGNIYINEDDLINSKSDVVYIASPDNPTGYKFKYSIIDELCSKGKIVIFDETYDGFMDVELKMNLINKYNNLYFVGSFSKNFGAAGIRVGYVLSNPSNIENLMLRKPMFDINSIGCRYIEFLCENFEVFQSSRDRLMESKKYMEESFMSLGFEVLQNVFGNFIILKKTDLLCEYLNNICKYRTIVVDGLEFIRVTVLDKESTKKMIEEVCL